ncbi:MAG TPA: hypothetical protein VK081_03535 [Planctomycetota bacterium]|nr:hypothetical protein [Planctomycetota bacterium]
MFLVASLWLVDRLGVGGDWDLLAFSSGSLSYNVFPFLLLLGGVASVLFAAANALVSSVFLGAYFMRLTEDEAADPGRAEIEAA